MFLAANLLKRFAGVECARTMSTRTVLRLRDAVNPANVAGCDSAFAKSFTRLWGSLLFFEFDQPPVRVVDWNGLLGGLDGARHVCATHQRRKFGRNDGIGLCIGPSGLGCESL